MIKWDLFLVLEELVKLERSHLLLSHLGDEELVVTGLTLTRLPYLVFFDLMSWLHEVCEDLEAWVGSVFVYRFEVIKTELVRFGGETLILAVRKVSSNDWEP